MTNRHPLAKAKAHHAAGRLDSAEALYRALLETDADHPEANHGLGVLEIEGGRFESALLHLQRALEQSPETGHYWQSFAEGLLLAGRPEEALTVIGQALASGLDTPAAQDLRARLATGLGEPTPVAVPTFGTTKAVCVSSDGGWHSTKALIVVDADRQANDHERLLGLLQAGQLAPAETLARDLGARDPGDHFAWKVLGTLLVQDDRCQAAIPILELARQLAPEDAETLNNLGRAYQMAERADDALALYRHALALRPEFAECWNNQGMTQHALGQLDASLDSYDRALALQPTDGRAHNNRGNVLRELERFAEALACHDRALALDPQSAEAHSNRGLALQELERIDEALACHAQALSIRQDVPDIWVNLGVTLRGKGRIDEALTAFDQALTLNPNSAEAHGNRGLVLQALGRLDEALKCFERALAIKPRSAEALNNLGILLRDLGRLDAARASLDQALTIKPDYAAALINRGNVLKDLGQLDAALADDARAIAIKPDFSLTHSNALFTLNYHPDKSAAEIFAAYRKFDQRFGEPQRASWQPHANARDPERRLRIGYVSPDFRAHSASHFLEPLLAHHDRGAVEITAYAELTCEDAVSARYRRVVDHWVLTWGLTDDKLAERIRADRIDILVDLAGHTANNRLSVFARRPAPVAVSWMGFGYTTGLRSIDYFLADEVMAPPGSEDLFAEQPWRIAVPSLVYRPADGMGDAGSLPALNRGNITFGTLTRSIRINHRTIRVWSAILQQVTGARLLIDSRDFVTPAMQQRLAERFAAHGIGPDRLELGYHSPPWDVLRGIDIGLDCFPHNSGTTLIESLYMGVPFVTLAERPSVGRIGSMMLAGAGHREWIAASEDDYIGKAVALASDLERLATIRAGLRGELETGPWCDEVGFARRVEQAYRKMWRRWCAEGHCH